MPPASAVFVQDNLLPLEFVSLGRFVLNTQEPNHSYRDPAEKAQEAEKPQSNVRDILRRSKGTSLYAKLSGLFEAKTDQEAASDVFWSTRHTKTVQQLDSDGYFAKACAEPETRKWLEKALENGRDVYMMVGYATAFNATVSDQVTAKKKTEIVSQAPVKEMMTAMTGNPAPTVMVKNPVVGGETRDNMEHKRAFKADGEQVFAIQYRKLMFRFFSSKNLDKGFLEEESRWKLYWALMGGEEEEDDDVVEATLDGDFGHAVEGFEGWQDQADGVSYFVRGN
ncbi:hypothetical protein AYL99_00401 [Fonsecaea erecta]|uniref:Uncharacterized protein n=1 Tax=Fonsecaea erecta TaxID=1367422 RepID=A0A178ZX87_9EURO|nr:hypothetical protein AYL99_00401 [Fonsecaea erecta]OAP64429.1 hypothetical protein AYL99_00401 [Fonsecaea erecta]